MFISVSETTELLDILDQFEALGRGTLPDGRAYVVFDEAREADVVAADSDFERHAIDLPDARPFPLDRLLVMRPDGSYGGG